MEIIDLPDFFGRTLDEDKYLRYSDYKTSGMRMELTSKGKTMVDGESVDFAVNTMTWDESFTLYFDDYLLSFQTSPLISLGSYCIYRLSIAAQF